MKSFEGSDIKIRQNIVSLLSDLIKNQCVNRGRIDSGHEERNASLLHAFFEEAGINSIVDTVEGSRSSIVAEVLGSDSAPLVYGLMGHLDVVPADEKSWSFDPFGGDYDDHWVYGRGAVDMLGQVSVMAVALRDLIARKGTPKQTVRFFGMADEEAEGVLGAARLLESQFEQYRCDYMLTELGGYFLDPNHIALSAAEKGVLRLKLCSEGRSGHGSMTYRSDNAILKLSEALNSLIENISLYYLTPEAREMILSLPIESAIAQSLLKSDEVDQALDQLWAKSPGLAKLIHSALHLTLSPGVITGGSKVNVIPDYAELLLDIRIPFGMSRESVLEKVEEAISVDGITLEAREYFAPNSSSLNNPFYNAVASCVSSIYPETRLVPVVPAGVTDGRYWRDKGTVVYGFSLYSREYDYDFFSAGLHGVDEKIDIESLVVGYRFFTKLLSQILY